jgi:magnesium-transporting ATPase (P-type)
VHVIGRISYLFTDKTGTLTRNVMTFKVLQMKPPVRFDTNSLNSVNKFPPFALLLPPLNGMFTIGGLVTELSQESVFQWYDTK